MRRIRVLHIVQNLNYGGMERLIAELALRTDRSRFETHVLALEYLGRFADGLQQVATLHTGPRMSRWSLLRPSELARVIHSIAPDVVHTHSGVWYKAGLAARLAGVPRVIHTEHGRKHPDLTVNRVVDSLAARRTDVVVAVSAALGSYLGERVVPESTAISVTPNGVDTDAHRPRADDGSLRRELALGEHRPIIGSIGRLEPVKGYDIMLEAFARLRAHWVAPTPLPALVLAGDGSERQRLVQVAAELDIARDVHFLGWRDDIHALHALFQLFTMSSRSEGTCVSLLEAMSAGLCPIVTDVGGNADALGAELQHRLVPAESPDALAAAWYHALVDKPELLLDDGARARQRVVDWFNIHDMVRQYERLYAGEMGDAHASRTPAGLRVSAQGA